VILVAVIPMVVILAGAILMAMVRVAIGDTGRMDQKGGRDETLIAKNCSSILLISRRILAVAIMLAFLTLAQKGVTVFAQGGYPEPTDPYINDYAGLLSNEDAVDIRTLFTNLKREHGVEATVVTINSIRDYDRGDKTIESFASNLFNTWGIGDKERNNGVLILVAVNDRKMRIEVGSGYGDSQDANMQEVINEHMLPNFKREQYSYAIYRGAQAVVGKLTGEWPEDLRRITTPTPQSSSQTNYTSQAEESNSSSLRNPLNYLGILLVFGIAVWYFFDVGRIHQHWNGDGSDGKREETGQKATGVLIGAATGLTFSFFTWLSSDIGTALWLSNFWILVCTLIGAILGFLTSNAGSSSRYSGSSILGGDDFIVGGDFGGGDSDGDGANGDW
jgi:uncharacterized membrane protein YgcG